MTATQEVRPGTPPSRGRRKSKQENMFGPYSLLYTIGEGEFAKVKYGIHSESGSESAIKLIRKENVDTEKLSKIKREISVLKSLQHPYIVKLVEVIETQNYIGIVLEFASGGELFDHILAHRYLKEQEASRLFAQLICGVDYLHRNKIIHRDLKLENLLLDRDRNIIITDFGFANQFGKNGEDLMATSCGSPCYAAPELVVSDGMYAGSAVDVWSCGVILYAMLAGFLPYDDDPANPEGDNINLLYKYILSTPLSFPDYIGSDARDLLKRMLVPDPAKRCKIKDIMNHRWLAQYKGLFEVFILKAKLEFVTGSPSSPEIISSSPESKSKRQVFEADSSPFIAEKVIAGKGLLDTLDSELSDAQILPETPQEKESPPTGSAPIEVNLTKQNHPSCSTIESGYEFSHHLDNGLDSGMSVPLSPLEPAAGALVSHQAYNSFGPNSVVTYNNRSYDRPEVDESRHEFRRHHSTRKEKTSFTPVANAKANKARPVSMQPVPSKQRKASGRPSYDGTYDHGTHVASTSRSNRATHGRRHSKSQNDPTVKVVTVMDSTSPKPAGSKPVRPASMDPNNARYGVYSTPQLDVLNEPTRRSNRRDERKAMSVAMSSFPLSEPLNDPIRQSTLSPTTNTAQRITDWIKRKSVIIKAGSTPNVPPMNATLADLSSYGEQRSGVALPRGSFNLPRENGPAYRLRYHRGAVDQFALTSRDPSLVMSEVRLEVVSMGFIIDKASDFKFKITRPARETGTSSHSSSRRFTLVGLRDLLQILPRSSNSSPRGGARSYPSAPDSLYGEPSIDNGEEMKLSLELCKIKNFPNLYSLDIKRIKGNVWSYKFLYHFILEQLQLNSNGGYLNP